jgi:TusA-related sulfurtransferase
MSAEKSDYKIDDDLNLRGEVCPYTFVKSKLVIEKMDINQVLKITVDNSESASNVPRSLELEGHEVLVIEKEGRSTWNIIVRKVADPNDNKDS